MDELIRGYLRARGKRQLMMPVWMRERLAARTGLARICPSKDLLRVSGAGMSSSPIG